MTTILVYLIIYFAVGLLIASILLGSGGETLFIPAFFFWPLVLVIGAGVYAGLRLSEKFETPSKK